MHAEAKIATTIYVVLTSRGTDSPIFYSVEYDDKTPDLRHRKHRKCIGKVHESVKCLEY